MKREVKVKELKVLDATRRRFMHHQTAVKEAELKRMDTEIQRRALRRDVETKACLDDIEVRALELERQKGLLEHELARCQEEVCRLHCHFMVSQNTCNNWLRIGTIDFIQ